MLENEYAPYADRHTQSRKQQSFFYKAGFKSDIYTNLFLYNKILFKNLQCILLISEGFFFFSVLFFSKCKAGDLWAREFYAIIFILQVYNPAEVQFMFL